MDIAASVATLSAQTQRSAELDSREREYGGLVPGDREAERILESVKGWTAPYRASINYGDVRDALDNPPDPREITTGRLMFDVARAVRRWCGGWSRDDRDAIANGAALLLLRWPTNGGGLDKDGNRTPVLDLGGLRSERMAIALLRRSDAPSTARAARMAGDAATQAGTNRRVARMAQLDWIDRAERMLSHGTLPLRRDWVDPESKMPTPLAIRALRAAVKQSAESLRDSVQTDSGRKMRGDVEIAHGPLDITKLREDEAAERGDVVRLPYVNAPELIARYLDVPLNAARALVIEAFPGTPHSELASQWNVSLDRVKVALSIGRAVLRDLYPDPIKLVEALATIGPEYRTDCERGAILALIDYRDAMIGADVASGAIAEWRESSSALSDESRALLAAARSAIKRSKGQYGSERAERIAASVPRLLAAEISATRRAGASHSAPQRAGSLDWRSGYVSAPASAESVAERRALYARCAADESAASGLTSRIANTCQRVPAPTQIALHSAPRVARTGALHACAKSAQRALVTPIKASALVKLTRMREALAQEIDAPCPDGHRVRTLRADIASTLAAARA